MSRAVKIKLSGFALEALGGSSPRSAAQVRQQAAHALRYYLSDKKAGRPGWAYPGFLRTRGGAEKPGLELEVGGELGSSLEAEAGLQGVSVDELGQHAVLYFVADRAAGRVTDRIRAA